MIGLLYTFAIACFVRLGWEFGGVCWKIAGIYLKQKITAWDAKEKAERNMYK